MAELVQVSLSITDPARFDTVLARALALGLRVEESFPALGVVTGVLPTAALRGLDGVGAVELQRGYKPMG